MSYFISVTFYIYYYLVMETMRLRYLDIARGLAMIMVIVGHIIQPEIMGNTLRYFLFAVHLPLFLIISGVLFKEKDYKSLIGKNINKLVLPYFLGILFMIVIFIIGYHQDIFMFWHNTVSGNMKSVTSIIKAAVLVNGGDYYEFLPQFNISIGAIWYLIGYFETTIIFNIIIKLVKNKWGQLVVIGIITIIGYVIGSYTAVPFQLLSSFVMLPFLGAGYYTKTYWIGLSLRSIKIDFSLIIIGIIFWYLSGKNGILLLVSAQATQGVFLGTMGGIMGSFAILTIIRWFESQHTMKFLKSFFIKAGKNSLMMMVVHTLDLRVFPVSFYSIEILNRITHREVLSIYLAMIVAIIFAYYGAIAMNWTGKYIISKIKYYGKVTY